MYLRTNKVKNGAEELFALCKESFAGKVRDFLDRNFLFFNEQKHCIT